MARKLSRRLISRHVAQSLQSSDNSTKVIKQLAAYLVDARRTGEVDLLVRDIEHELSISGTVIARVTTANSLSEQLEKNIAKFVKDQSGAKTVLTEYSRDPSILGGFKLDLPGKQLDRTISGQLMTLRTKFKKV